MNGHQYWQKGYRKYQCICLSTPVEIDTWALSVFPYNSFSLNAHQSNLWEVILFYLLTENSSEGKIHKFCLWWILILRKNRKKRRKHLLNHIVPLWVMDIEEWIYSRMCLECKLILVRFYFVLILPLNIIPHNTSRLSDWNEKIFLINVVIQKLNNST